MEWEQPHQEGAGNLAQISNRGDAEGYFFCRERRWNERARWARPKGHVRILRAPPCVCFRFCGWLPKARGMSPGGAGVAVEHIQATLVGEIIDDP